MAAMTFGCSAAPRLVTIVAVKIHILVKLTMPYFVLTSRPRLIYLFGTGQSQSENLRGALYLCTITRQAPNCSNRQRERTSTTPLPSVPRCATAS